MLIKSEAKVVYDKHDIGHYLVSVANGLLAMGMAAVCVTRAGQGCREIVWNEVIEIESAAGFPVKHKRHDGRVVDYGGPSHPFRDMALRRAADLLEGRIEEAKGFATQASIDAAVAARRARRAGMQAGEG